MHGIRAEQPVDLDWPHNLGRNPGRDVLLGQPARGIFGEQELAEAPLRVGERQAYGVPAIEDDRAVEGGLAAAKLWPAFLLIPLVLLGWRARRLGC